MSKKRKWKRCFTAYSAAIVVLFSATVPAYALENKTDTIWGSVPASVYITKEFYEGENTIEIPKKYFDAIEEDITTKEKAINAFWEAQRQSCYLYGDRSVSVTVGSDTVTITRNPYYDLETESAMRSTVEAEAEKVLDRILYNGMSDYEKARAIYNYVRQTSTYDWDAYNAIVGEDCHGNISKWAKAVSAYGVLIDGKSVCQGDAQAYTLLARKAGLTTMMATGKMQNGGGHAWNRVWCNSQWYEVDCCFEEFCPSFEIYTANTGVTYGGVGIMESSTDSYYGV